MTTYLENYLASVSTLPAELKRNFILLRDLDDRTQGVLNKVDRIASQYRGSGKKTLEEFLTPDELTAVKAELADAVRIGEEKIQIANHSYEVVDKHIRRLDQDLKKFEEELERERVHQEQMQEQALIAMGKPKKRKRDDTDAGASKSSRTSRNRNASRSLEQLKSPDYDSDLPVDPNEPTYCNCNRVSYGEMVGCDNDNCPIEWFHFECVGLSEKPKGKWYCSDECRATASAE